MRKLTREDFIERARAVHGDKYNYDKVVYADNHTKVIITCPEDGDFLQRPNNHLLGIGCPACSYRHMGKSRRISGDEFIRRARKTHGDRYDYPNLDYRNIMSPVTIVCKQCGKTFKQVAKKHIDGQGCPVCRQSKLEEIIMTELDDRNIRYAYQYRNPFLGQQSLDFYLPDINVGIEAQGIQHYRPVSFGGHIDPVVFFEENQERDERKRKACRENGVKLFHFTQVVGVTPDEETYTDINVLMDTIEEMLSTEPIISHFNVESPSQGMIGCASS